MLRTRYRVGKMLVRGIGALAALMLPWASAAIGANDADSLQRFDEYIMGMAITNVCNPSFVWSKPSDNTATIGRKAYEQLLSELESKAPNDSTNPMNADRALKLRTEELLRKAGQNVAEKGCGDLEIETLRNRFESGA